MFTEDMRASSLFARQQKTRLELLHIMLALASGVRIEQIARKTGMSRGSVSQRLTSAYGRYGASSRLELLAILLQRGDLTLEDVSIGNLQKIRQQFAHHPSS